MVQRCEKVLKPGLEVLSFENQGAGCLYFLLNLEMLRQKGKKGREKQ
jgi:hypothetical protein